MYEFDRFGFRSLKGLYWDLDRFGLTPSRLIDRVSANNELSKIFVVSVPKAGTHLLERIIIWNLPFYRKVIPTIHPNFLKRNNQSFAGLLDRVKSGQIVISHYEYDDDIYQQLIERDFKILFLCRRPFDILRSKIRFVQTHKKHRRHELFKDLDYLKIAEIFINGSEEKKTPPFHQQIVKHSNWLQKDKVLPIKFEELLNRDENNEVSTETLKKIFNFLDYDISDESLGNISRNAVFKHSLTYSNSKIPDKELAKIKSLYDQAGDIDSLFNY